MNFYLSVCPDAIYREGAEKKGILSVPSTPNIPIAKRHFGIGMLGSLSKVLLIIAVSLRLEILQF